MLQHLVSTQHTMVGATIINTALLLLLMCSTHALRLIDYTPSNGPISGGTLIHIRGEGFITTGSERSRCRFQQRGRGSVLSVQNDITNSSYMTCEVPVIPFLTESELQNGHTLNLSIITGTSTSNDVIFFVYDLSTMSITQIIPDEGLTNVSDITLSVSTSGILNTSELTCSLAELRSQTLVPATFINSTLIHCHPLLPYPDTSTVQIEVSLNGQSAANIPTATNDATLFTFFSPPPEVVSCEFTPSYALLLLTFDREVEIGGENRSMGVLPSTELSCEMIFVMATLEVIGSGSQCTWHNTQQRQVIIQLTDNTLVQLGTVLSLRSDTIRARYLQFSRLVNDSVSVSSVLDPQLFRPSAIIETPRVIPTCGNITISGAKSQYGGVRPLEFEWIIGTKVNVTTGQLIQDDSLVSYVPEGFTRQATLVIPATAFNTDDSVSGSGSGSGIAPVIMTRNNNYTIQLSVRNFLGVVSTAGVDGITLAERLIPNLVIVGGTLRHLRSSLENTLQGMVLSTSEECSQSDSVFHYMWSVSDDSNMDVEFDSVVNTNSSVLVLPPRALRSNSVYTAILVVRYGGENDVVSDSVTIVTDVEIRAMIRGGTRRALGVNHVITLDGSMSSGVTSLPSNTTLMVTWACQVAATNDSSCNGVNGETLLLNNTELVQRIESDRLVSDMEYQFSLTLTLVSNHRNEIILESTAYQIVLIFPHPVPLVELYPSPGLDLSAVLIHRELTLLASIRSSTPGNVTWTSEYVAGYGQLELREDLLKTPLHVPIISAAVIETHRFTYREDQPVLFTSPVPHLQVPTFINQLSLVVKENTLLSQNSYRLKLTAVDVLGRTGFAELDIQTATQPTSGLLEISPLIGRPLSTVFTLSALGWTDDIGETPLLYRFGLRYHYIININTVTTGMCCDGGGGVARSNCVCDYWLSGVTEVNQLSTILPLTLANTSTDDDSVDVNVVLQIYDNKGAVTEVVNDLRRWLVDGNADIRDDGDSQLLQPLAGENNEIVNISTVVDGIRRMLHDTGNWVQSLAHITAVIVTVESELTHSVLVNQTSRLNLTDEDVELFRLESIQLILDIYDSYLPLSKSYLDIIMSLLHKTITPMRGESLLLSDSIIAKVVSLVENVVTVYNSFERGAAFSNAGLNKREGFVVLDVMETLILAGSEVEDGDDTSRLLSILRIRADDITTSLLRIIPSVGYSLCLQQALNEESVFVRSSTEFVTLKSSHIHLPSDYTAGTNPELSVGENIVVNFTRDIFREYLQWQCTDSDDEEEYCSGVCIASTQYAYNIVWQGGVYSSHTKTPLLQLALINTINGQNVFQPQAVIKRQISNQNLPMVITFPITAPFSNTSALVCVHWQEQERVWSENGCHTTAAQFVPSTSSTQVVCECSPAELRSNPLTVVERCPHGYYGELCDNVCPQDLWGPECQRSCDCSNRGQCSPVDGSCDCIPGWTGNRCEQRCSVGTWGDGCGETCLCENGASCDPVSGSCACTPGWIGTHCNNPCPDGFYGNDCARSCECRDITECTDKINGGCTCQAGFTGTTCEQTCPTGFYGLRCESECECSSTGTRICDPANGLCDCLDSWRGFLCETEVTTPAPTTPVPVPSFEIWWIVVGVIAALLIVAVTVIVIIGVAVWVRKKKRTKVLPISEEDGGAVAGSSHQAWKNEVATTPGSSDGSELEMTRTRSLEVLIPPGKSLKDMFTPDKTKSSNVQDFKEPDRINDKLRWQVVRLKQTRPDGTAPLERVPAKSGVMESSVDDDEDHVTEVIYKQGIYLTSDSTLKHLRNAFIDSKQLESHDRYFQFLRSDVPGDYVEIDTEDEVLLVQIETSLLQHRTLYIETIDSGDVQAELCVCGKYADMECSKCEKRGYCSLTCQQNDWLKHEAHCRSVVESRRERKSAKKHRKKHRKHRKSSRASNSSARRTPVGMLLLSEDICTCGKEAEFECSKCGKQGYCSQKCQQDDWNFHEYYCNQSGSNATSPRWTVITPPKQPVLSAISSNKKLLTVQEEHDEDETEQSQ